MTSEIEDCFLAKKKVGAIFVDLTKAYHTIWHRGLIWKLITDRLLKRMIVKLVHNCIFTVTIGNGRKSRLRHPKNGVPQSSSFL